MHAAARRLAVLLAGLGFAAPAVADPERPEPSPYNRRYETTRPDGSKKTVIELATATDQSVSPPPGEPNPPVPAVPGGSGAPPDGVFVKEICPCRPTFWAEVDYLQWWYRGTSVPPLVTAGSAADLNPGAVGQPGTVVLSGGDSHQEWTSGARLRLGGWEPGAPVGWEVGGFYLRPQTTAGIFTAPILARPFYDTFLNTETALSFAFPGAFEGTVSVLTRTTFWGLEANGTAALDAGGATVGFAGFRYLQMTDELAVSGSRTFTGPSGLSFINAVNLLPGGTTLLTDRVFTRNEFYGAQLGLKHHAEYGRFGLDVRGAVAVGVGTERVVVQGSTATVDADGTRRDAVAGLLAQPSNSGQFEKDRLTVVPEVGARLAYRVAPWLSIHAGYDFLYWASVARAADQVDHVIDTRQMPTSSNFSSQPGFRPVVPLRDTAFWAHGVNFGLTFEF